MSERDPSPALEFSANTDLETEAAILEHVRQDDALYSTPDLRELVVGRLAELYAPEVISIGTGADEIVFGLAQHIEHFKRDISQVEKTWKEWTWRSVYSEGNVACLIGECAVFWLANGSQNSMAMRITNIYERREGRWLLLHQHCSVPDRDQPVGQSYPSPIETIAVQVSAGRPSLQTHAAPDGTLAILFTDIENSTNLTERLGDRLWLDVLEDHNKLVREQLMAHDCLEVKSLGDGFMIVSKSAPQALKCAISIRRELSGHNKMAKEPIRVRIGLHAGEVLRHADDFFGKHVIVAQRIAGKARGDEILASEVIKDMVRGVAGVRFGAAREVELKGLSGTFIVHPVTLR